jgi:phage FluMu protein Com
VLFRGFLASGSVVEVQCKRCKELHTFRAGE